MEDQYRSLIGGYINTSIDCFQSIRYPLFGKGVILSLLANIFC